MMIGRTSLGRVAAAISQLALYVEVTCDGRAMGGAGEGRGQVAYWAPLCRSGGVDEVFGENDLFEWLAECDRGA